jgi:quercetin dioxygenase-like cupin family protein
MQFRTIGLLLLGAMALPASGTAQTPPAPPAVTRTVIATTKLPTVTDVPVHFKVVSITLQPDERSTVSAANGILYQISGSTGVALDGEAKMLNAGEGLFIAGGKAATLTAGSEGPSIFLHFFLAPSVDLDRAAETPTPENCIARRVPSPTCSQVAMISISPESRFRRRCLPTRPTIGQARLYTLSSPAPGTTPSTVKQKQGDRVP